MAAVLAVVALSTLYDMKKENSKSKNSRDLCRMILINLIYPDGWLVAFSLSRNIQSMLSTDDGAGDIQAVHGVRMFNALVLMGTYVIYICIKNQFSEKIRDYFKVLIFT